MKLPSSSQKSIGRAHTRTLCIFVLSWFGVLSIAYAIDTSLPPQPTEQEKQFLSSIEHAIATTNVSALTKLDYVVGMPPGESAVVNGMFYQSMIERGCTRVKLERVDPTVATTHKSATGDVVVENLPVRWIVTVVHPSTSPGVQETTELRAGLFEDKIRFTQTEEKK
jgi:hypothetical protein